MQNQQQKQCVSVNLSCISINISNKNHLNSSPTYYSPRLYGPKDVVSSPQKKYTDMDKSVSRRFLIFINSQGIISPFPPVMVKSHTSH